MLLVSCITPSSRSWVLESARSIAPSANIVSLAEVDFAPTQDLLGRALGVVGGQVTSPDLLAQTHSFRDVLALLIAWESSDLRSSIISCNRSAGHIAADLNALRLLLDSAGAVPAAQELSARLLQVENALGLGDIEWLLGCPPQPDAVDQATIEVAVATGAGVTTRGVVVAPMPRASDGWPKAARVAARSLVEELGLAVHPVPVQRARGGRAPVLDARGDRLDVESITLDASGERLITFTLPGLAHATVEVGTWSCDAAYPVTHVVLKIDGVVVRRSLDATLRRCQAVDAVWAGDTISVTFVPSEQHWPLDDDSEGA